MTFALATLALLGLTLAGIDLARRAARAEKVRVRVRSGR